MAASAPPQDFAAFGTVPQDNDLWECGACTFINTPGLKQCGMCQAARPAADVAAVFVLIEVRFLLGAPIDVRLKSTATVRLLKLKIEAFNPSFKPWEQTILLNGRQLSDNEILGNLKDLRYGTYVMCVRKVTDAPPAYAGGVAGALSSPKAGGAAPSSPTASSSPPPAAASGAQTVICPTCEVLIAVAEGMLTFRCPRCKTTCRAPPKVMPMGAASIGGGFGGVPSPTGAANTGAAGIAGPGYGMGMGPPMGGAPPGYFPTTSPDNKATAGGPPPQYMGMGGTGAMPVVTPVPVMMNTTTGASSLPPPGYATNMAGTGSGMPVTGGKNFSAAGSAPAPIVLVVEPGLNYDDNFVLSRRLHALHYPEGHDAYFWRNFWMAQIPGWNIVWWLYLLCIPDIAHRPARRGGREEWWDTVTAKTGTWFGFIIFCIWFPIFIKFGAMTLVKYALMGALLGIYLGTLCCLMLCWSTDDNWSGGYCYWYGGCPNCRCDCCNCCESHGGRGGGCCCDYAASPSGGGGGGSGVHHHSSSNGDCNCGNGNCDCGNCNCGDCNCSNGCGDCGSCDCGSCDCGGCNCQGCDCGGCDC